MDLFKTSASRVCLGTLNIIMHVDDMLAVRPCEITMNLWQELSQDVTMRWDMVTHKSQEFLGCSLCRTQESPTLKESNTLSFEKNLTTMTLSCRNRDNDVTDS